MTGLLWLTMRTLISIIAIVFATKGLGGSFNAVFYWLGLARIHGPVVGGVIALLLFVSFITFRRPTHKNDAPKSAIQKVVFILALVALMSVGSVIRINGIRSSKLTIEQADMLPTILTQIKDFLDGNNPYGPNILANGEHVLRMYLPALWGTYLPFYVLGLDIRYLNLIAQLLCYVLLAICFWQKGRYFNWSFSKSAPLFFALIALHVFSKESFGDVLTVETGPFWLYYALLAWSVIQGKSRLTNVLIPLVILCRQPAFLLIVPYWIWLARTDRPELWRSLVVTAAIGFLVSSPFLIRDPGGFFRGVAFYGKLADQTSLDAMLSWYGLLGVLKANNVLWLQIPLQTAVFLMMCGIALKRKDLDGVQALGLGGVIYLWFMLLAPVTFKYLFVEPLILCYFLLNCPPLGPGAPVSDDNLTIA